jgi:hypothetical protein
MRKRIALAARGVNTTKFWKIVPAAVLAGGLAAAAPAVAASASPVATPPAGVNVGGPIQYAPQLAHLAPKTHLPEKESAHADAPPGTYYSGNWAGYVDIAHAYKPFTYIGATFAMPVLSASEKSACVTAAEDDSYGQSETAYWVGFDGWSNGTVEQTGTATYCLSNGTVGIYAWYEMYPASPDVFTFTGVNPGDKIVVTVTYSGSDKYDLYLHDVTNGGHFNAVTSGKDVRGSAEVITEDPGGGPAGGWYLADYGVVNYTGSFVKGAGVTGTMNSSSPWSGGNRIDEEYDSVMQSTTVLNSNGTDFSDVFDAAS